MPQADQTLDETALTERSITHSPFLPGTKIQYAGTEEEVYARWLIEHAIVNGECWECHLAPIPSGYCYTQVGGRSGFKWRVHRLIYTVINGDIPKGEIVRHTCDNRKCMRPSHLICGTHADNTDDMMQKGRHKFIPRTDHRHKDAIMNLHRRGLGRFEIARQLMVSPNTVWNYVSPKGPYYDGE